MFHALVESAMKNRLWVIFAFVIVCIAGLLSVSRLPIDAVPDITNVQVVVNTKTKALDPGKIEKLVTFPIESELSGIPGVEEVRSLSKYGLSQIVVIFEENTNIYFARQLIAERLEGVRGTLPDGLSPELAPVTTGLGEVLMYVLEPKAGTPLAAKPEKDRLLYLREIQEFTIRPRLKRLPGVADIDTNGGLMKQIHINFSTEKLQQYGLSVEKFISKIETLGESFGGGYIQKEGKQVIVRATGQLSSLETLGNLPISLNIGGRPIRIKDVAEVRVDNALRVGAATTSGHETVLGTVLMRIGANSRSVASVAESALKSDIQLPNDVDLKIVYSRSHLVNATIRTVLKNLAEGAILVIVVLLLLLGNFRAAIVVALAIPISMLFALKGMEIFGISANLMSLGAIDFGLIVDGAVVLIENVMRRLEERKAGPLSRPEKFKLVMESTEEVIKPLTFGLFIIMLVYVPILYLEGIEGKMFRPMASTVLLALFASLLIALFLMPALAYWALPDSIEADHEPKLFRWIKRWYEPGLLYALNRKWIVPVVTVLPAAIAIILFLRMGSDFAPQLNEGDLVINLARTNSQGIDESVLKQKQAEEIIMKYQEVETVFSRMGTPESALDPMGPHLADTFVILKHDLSQWPKVGGKRKTKDELFEALKKDLLAANPDQDVTATQPIEMRFNEIMEGSRADVALRIYGPDLDQLLEYSEKAERILKDIRGVSELEKDPLTALSKSPVLDVILDYEKMARYGLSLRDVNSVLESAMSGREVGSFYEEDRRFPILLHLDEKYRDDVKHISSVPVSLPEGGTIPLSSVASIQEKDQVTTVARGSSRRYSALSIFLRDRDIASFVAEAKQKIAKELKIAPGYELSWGGQFKNLERARTRLMIIVPLTLAFIFVLLLRSFGNIRHASLVFSAIPFAVVGGVFALYVRGINFSVSAAIGFIALAGIAVLNSMVMVTFFNQMKERLGAGLKLGELVHDGAMARLRPVAMTALVASLGFLPMALNTGTGAEVQRPLATVVIGGLFTATVLTLIVVPIAYRFIEQKYGSDVRNKGGKP